jgi:hypothetical protein
MALISPGAPSATISIGAASARDQVAPEREPVLVGFAHPEADRHERALAGGAEPPGAQHALLGTLGADREVDRVEEQRHRLGLVQIAALERGEPLAQPQILAAVDLDSFPSPACSHSDSTSRIDRPRTNAPTTIARSGSVRNNLVPLGNSFETNCSAASRPCGISTLGSPSAVCSRRGR